MIDLATITAKCAGNLCRRTGRAAITALGMALGVALGSAGILGGCAQLGQEAPVSRTQHSESTAREWDTQPTAEPAAEPAPAAVSYDAVIEGVPEPDLLALLRQSSQLVSLRDRPPSSLAGLRRRAEGDRERLSTALRSEGFYGATVEANIDGSKSPARVTVTVATGDQYLLADYETRYLASPPPALESQASLEDLGLHIGMAARAPAIVAAQRTLLAVLGRRGHPLAKVLDRKTLVDHAAKTMTVRLDLDPGPVARFGPVAFAGLESIESDYLRGLLTWSEGETYDTDKVEAFRKILSRTGLFDSVAIEPVARTGDANALPVTIDLAEAKHRSIGFGADYSTSEGIGGEVFWEHRNLFGRNEQLRLGLTAAEIEQALSARLRKPSFLRSDQDLLIDGALTNRDTDAFEEQSFAGATTLERPFGERWRGSAGVTGEFSVIEDEEGETTFQLGGLPLAATYDSSNNLLDPSEGARLASVVTPYSGRGEKALIFAVATLTGSAYQALDSDRRFVLAGRAKVGTLIGEETNDIPANKRFYAGGGGSIRGYEFQSVGPLDAENDPLGGRSVIELNAEARVKITEDIGLVAFVDGGSAFDSIYPDFEETLRWAGGLGARYFSPVGPIRLDVAVPLNQRDIDDDFQFYISLGQAF